MARVSRVLRSEAERALYHTVSLGRDESFLRTLCFCRAVQQCSRRATSVKALRLDVSAAIIPSSDEPVLPLLVNALRAITHVERLELRVFADWFLSACLEDNALDVHFPALKSLVIDLPPHTTEDLQRESDGGKGGYFAGINEVPANRSMLLLGLGFVKILVKAHR